MPESAGNGETEKLSSPETMSDFDEVETNADTQGNYREELTDNELQIIQQVKKFDMNMMNLIHRL
jgi:hypothetical protein